MSAQAADLLPDPSRTAIMPEEQAAQKQREADAAEAAKKNADASAAADTKNIDISKASDKQIAEAQRFYKSCTNNQDLSFDHDCRCMAGEFLANRMVMGDSVPAKKIYAAVRNLCTIDPNRKAQDDDAVGGDDFTDAELEEAQAVYNQCMGDQLMKINHDCRCMASTFLQNRRQMGRIPKPDQILVSMRNVCKNGTEMAGYLYTDCINKPDFLPPAVRDAKKFCECYANGFAKEFERMNAENNVQNRSSIALIVMGTCQNDQRVMGAPGSQ